MKATDLKTGMKMIFTPTGAEFIISNVTDKKISWWTGIAEKSSWGKNTMRRACTSIRIFQRGIDNGTYIIK